MSTRFSTRRCPKCGSTLLTNSRNDWCSFIGGGQEKACDYGIASPVLSPKGEPVIHTRTDTEASHWLDETFSG